jgi:fibronectin type 3 domain-containing protein
VFRKPAWIVLTALTICSLTFSAYSNTTGTDSQPPKPRSVTLKWTPSPGATSYNIFRSEVAGGPYKKVGSSPTANYVDTPVPEGAVLYYVVTALSSKGESGYSAEIKIVVPK